jgi:HEAT repeat protein
MRSILRVFTLATFFAAALTGDVSAQQPQVSNGQVSSQTVDHGLQFALDALKQSATPLWAGYIISTSSTFNAGGNSKIAYLEPHNFWDETAVSKSTTEDSHAIILFRLAAGKIDRVRAEAVDRQLDAGGLRFVWLTNVTPEDSIATLKTLCLTSDSNRLVDSAVFLISIHQLQAAVPALIALTAPGDNLHLREQAAFWLANHGGHEGFVAIQNFARTDKDDKFRAKLAFDLTQSKDPGALDEIVRMAHEDSSPGVRSQAQFWMASRGGKIVTASLRDTAGNDPDASIRKKAVFAISRLPDGEATTQLVELAQTSRYPEVRKEAVFWLGQSNDPKALDFLTKLITSVNR